MSQPDLSVPDKNGNPGPSSQIDIYALAAESTVDDDFLQRNNLGLGNYSNKEYWQQIESYGKGLYAEAAFTNLLLERAIQETKYKMAKQEWDQLDEDDQQAKDRRRFIEAKMVECWADLAPGNPDRLSKEELDERREQAAKRRLEKIEEHTGITRDWIPPHWRMMQMRHDTSRSRGARLLDNLFGRVRKFIGKDPSKDDSQMAKLRRDNT